MGAGLSPGKEGQASIGVEVDKCSILEDVLYTGHINDCHTLFQIRKILPRVLSEYLATLHFNAMTRKVYYTINYPGMLYHSVEFVPELSLIEELEKLCLLYKDWLVYSPVWKCEFG